MVDKPEAASDIPFLSFNAKITSAADVTLPPPAESKRTEDPKLGASWTLWEQLEAAKGSAIYAGERPVVSFSTAKEFWACWNHVPQPSELFEGKKFVRMEKNGQKQCISGFSIFRKGIKPEWEDPANASGGHFQLELKAELGGALIDELWNNVILGMVGGLIEPADQITGARLIDKLVAAKGKPVVRIELWFKDMDDEDGKFKLRGNFEKMLRTKLDGSEGPVRWSYTQTKPHNTH